MHLNTLDLIFKSRFIMVDANLRHFISSISFWQCLIFHLVKNSDFFKKINFGRRASFILTILEQKSLRACLFCRMRRDQLWMTFNFAKLLYNCDILRSLRLYFNLFINCFTFIFLNILLDFSILAALDHQFTFTLKRALLVMFVM